MSILNLKCFTHFFFYLICCFSLCFTYLSGYLDKHIIIQMVSCSFKSAVHCFLLCLRWSGVHCVEEPSSNPVLRITISTAQRSTKRLTPGSQQRCSESSFLKQNFFFFLLHYCAKVIRHMQINAEEETK